MRDDAADLLALLVLLALVGESAGRAACCVLKLVVREGRGEETLAGEGERDALGVNGDPAAAPLLRYVSRRAGAAGRIEDDVTGIRTHEEATGYSTAVRLHDV